MRTMTDRTLFKFTSTGTLMLLEYHVQELSRLILTTKNLIQNHYNLNYSCWMSAKSQVKVSHGFKKKLCFSVVSLVQRSGWDVWDLELCWDNRHNVTLLVFAVVICYEINVLFINITHVNHFILVAWIKRFKQNRLEPKCCTASKIIEANMTFFY